MSCALYDNCGFGCGGCRHFVKTASITVDGTVLVLNIPQATYVNKEKACICLAQSIPDTATSAMTVAVTIGTSTTQHPLLTKCGNNVHADQLRSRTVLNTHTATDVGTFIMNDNCKLCKTSFNFPTIPAETTPAV